MHHNRKAKHMGEGLNGLLERSEIIRKWFSDNFVFRGIRELICPRYNHINIAYTTTTCNLKIRGTPEPSHRASAVPVYCHSYHQCCYFWNLPPLSCDRGSLTPMSIMFEACSPEVTIGILFTFSLWRLRKLEVMSTFVDSPKDEDAEVIPTFTDSLQGVEREVMLTCVDSPQDEEPEIRESFLDSLGNAYRICTKSEIKAMQDFFDNWISVRCDCEPFEYSMASEDEYVLPAGAVLRDMDGNEIPWGVPYIWEPEVMPTCVDSPEDKASEDEYVPLPADAVLRDMDPWGVPYNWGSEDGTFIGLHWDDDGNIIPS